jgi:hypothetical protein
MEEKSLPPYQSQPSFPGNHSQTGPNQYSGTPVAMPNRGQPVAQPVHHPAGHPVGQPGVPAGQQPYMQPNVVYAQSPTPVVVLSAGPHAVGNGQINSPYSVLVDCPYCGHHGMTQLDYEMGTFAWLVAAFLFCFFICFCPIVFCLNDVKDVVHRCPRCSNVLGRYLRM